MLENFSSLVFHQCFIHFLPLSLHELQIIDLLSKVPFEFDGPQISNLFHFSFFTLYFSASDFSSFTHTGSGSEIVTTLQNFMKLANMQS